MIEPSPEHLQSCYDELKRLSGLIFDLERLKSEETAGIVLEKTEIELRGLAEAVRKSFETRIREKDITAEVTRDASDVLADAGKLLQVFSNLVSNAVKYTDARGRIRIRIEDPVDESVVCVEDSGIGIPEEDLGRIFERFYRTDKSRNRKTGGAGIGLSIAKAIVQAHRGTIVCESENGKGSRCYRSCCIFSC